MGFYTDFAGYYERIFPFSRTVYGFLLEHLPGSPAQILDVGCGTGHYTGALAEAGYDAVGIDLDRAMIDYARAHYADAEFRVLNMLEITRISRDFDGAFCIGNSAAHLTQSQFTDFVDQIQTVLRPDGPWVLQVMNWDYVLAQERVVFPVLKGAGNVVFVREYRDISDAQVTFVTRLEVDGEVVFEDTTPLYPLRSDEITTLHESRGFRLVAHTGGYDGTGFDPAQFSANIFVFR